MKKNYNSIISTLFIIVVIVLLFYRMMPQDYSKGSVSLSEFSTQRALKHVKNISVHPHYVGSENHNTVFNYLELELRKLNLETHVQEGDVLSKSNNLVHTKNIIARIKGTDNSKALLLLTHYDSAPHSKSYGASDDANGLAAILEGIRAFKKSNTPHKNDIIILFSDGEELGLNGAFDFAKNHPWANEVGLIINFEARGSNGPSMMLAETNGGNFKLIEEFSKANPNYPVSNSLMYSIYKMLPNDTDLTAFRETKNIQGFNFAYIDDHFDYHTEQDNFKNFTPTCLEHQASYLMPLLRHFSNINLNELNSKEDKVYFNIPFGFIHYPNSWNLFLLIGAILLFIGTITIGIAKRVLDIKEIFIGFKPFFASLLIAPFIVFIGWKLILQLYPEYLDMLHGFTYNGHSYMMAFIMLTLAFCFWFYGKESKIKNNPSHFVAPLFIWIIICILVFINLKGASYFIIPLYFGIFSLAILVYSRKIKTIVYLLLSVPTLFILVPFIHLFPIGLGLKVLFGSAVLTVLTFSLLLPVFGNFTKKSNWALLLLIISIGFFIKAHLDSSFEKGKAKPNSLLYVYNANIKKANWATYDAVLDNWTKNYLTEEPSNAEGLNSNIIASKYKSGFSFVADAPIKNIQEPTFTFLKDTVIGDFRNVSILISPNRKTNRIDVFANEKMKLYNLKANGVKKINQEGSLFKRNKTQVINYYPIMNPNLLLEFQIHKNTELDMDVNTSSFDLLENNLFSIPKRPSAFIPMPFVLNDAIVVTKKITKQKETIQSTIKKPSVQLFNKTAETKQDSLETN